MRYLTLLLLTLIPIFSFGQFQDDFSDNDFSNNPTWLGDTDNFTVTSNELQLNDEDASQSTSQLYTNVLMADSTNWEFYARLEFSPSTSNFAKVYIQSDNSDLTGDLNGYFVKIGGISGSDDTVELYRQSGLTETLLISGEPGGVGGSTAEIRVRVTRDNAGNWELFADFSNGTNLVSQGTAMDNTFPTGEYLGVSCRYTSTRKDLFFFDDFVVDPIFMDTAAPELVNATAISSMEIDIQFSELVDVTSIVPSNFQIDGGLNIVSAELDMDNPALVHLVLDDNLVNGQDYEITINGVQDLNGNTLSNGVSTVRYFETTIAGEFELLINEFYPDKSPQIGLPDGEFIELYNPTSNTFDLQDYSIADNNLSFVNLPSFILLPDQYVILCNSEFASLYSVFGEVATVDLPALNDGGDDIVLISNEDGTTIHSLSYTKNWITDVSKQEGGWSYELKNPNSPCLGAENWDASNNLAGGTPGIANSILSTETDSNSPSLISAIPVENNQLAITFSENIDADIVVFDIDNNLEIDAINAQGNTIFIALTTDLQEGISYTITATNVADCIGNTADPLTAMFQLPEAADVEDIIINEILFDPVSGGADFVELYNRSTKTINLRGLEMGNTQNGQTSVISNDFVLTPGDYVVYTENVSAILENHTVVNPSALVEQDIPSFNNDLGNVTLSNSGTIIDAYDYSEDQHLSFIDDVEGVSLERINPDAESNNPNNWQSAAALANFATPTAQNSQFFQGINDLSTVFSLPYTTFSPDGDAFNDFLLLNYATDQPNYTCNIKIFDSEGRFIKDLVRSASLGSEGSFKWDGEKEDGSRARIGIYILWIELFDTNGNVQRFKEVCVLAQQL